MTEKRRTKSDPSKKDTGKKHFDFKPADRVANIEGSATLMISEIAKKLTQQGKKILTFSVGEPDFDTPEHIVNAAKEGLDKGYTHYTPSTGIPELREAVANYVCKHRDVPCEESNVIITPTKMGVFNSILAVVSKGDEVILPEPAWVTYRPCIQLAEGKTVSLKLYEEDNFRLKPENLAEAITPKTKAIILNSPCNPTGGLYSREDIKGIAELAVDHDLVTITDETYENIVFDGKHYSIASLPDMFERTISISGLSKSYAMTGWRIGWVVTAPPIFDQIKKLQEHSLTCATAFAQYAAITALSGPQQCVSDMVAEFEIRRDLIVEGINSIEGLHCTTPAGTFYAFIRYDFPKSSMDFAKFLMEHAGVALTPGSAFGEPGEGYLRLSFATSRDNINEGLSLIKNALEDPNNLSKLQK